MKPVIFKKFIRIYKRHKKVSKGPEYMEQFVVIVMKIVTVKVEEVLGHDMANTWTIQNMVNYCFFVRTSVIINWAVYRFHFIFRTVCRKDRSVINKPS